MVDSAALPPGKGGNVFPVEITVQSFVLDGQDVGLASCRDISERIRAEMVLRASEAKWKALYATLPVGVSVLDDQGKVADFNPMLGTILGIDADGLRQGRYRHRTYLRPDGTPMELDEFPSVRAVKEQRVVRNVEVGVTKEDGQVVWTKVSASPLNFPGLSCVVSTTDITERRQAEEAHARYELQFLRSQKLESLGLLAGGIAHRFNNLMGVVFGQIELAKDASKDSEVLSRLTEAMSGMDRARELTGQLLTFSRGGAPIRKLGDLFPIVRHSVESSLAGTNVSCQFDVQPGTWPCSHDKDQLERVFKGIALNAREAMPAGGMIEVVVRNVTLSDGDHPSLAPGKYFKVSIRDHGVGIPQEDQVHLFDPFFTTKFMGRGLGLAICHSIVKRHDGSIDVESELGKGSTFHVLLPAVDEAVPLPETTAATPARESRTILLMDDEGAIREAMTAMLRSLGYAVLCCSNGREAIDLFIAEAKREGGLAAIILDLTVPQGMGGKAAMREIRKLNAEIPAFVVSGYSDDPVMKEPATHGFTASICKPFRRSELSDMLNRYVRPGRRNAPLP